MKYLNSFVAILFMFACCGTALVSATIWGPGLWGTMFAVSGLFVFVSRAYLALDLFARGIAGLIALISILSLLLGLIASTIGGSFRIDQPTLLLFIGLFFMFSFGLIFALMRDSKNKSKASLKA